MERASLHGQLKGLVLMSSSENRSKFLQNVLVRRTLFLRRSRGTSVSQPFWSFLMVQRSKTVLMTLRHRWPERRQKEKGSEGRGGEDRVETAPTGGRLTTVNQRQTKGCWWMTGNTLGYQPKRDNLWLVGGFKCWTQPSQGGHNWEDARWELLTLKRFAYCGKCNMV